MCVALACLQGRPLENPHAAAPVRLSVHVSGYDAQVRCAPALALDALWGSRSTFPHHSMSRHVWHEFSIEVDALTKLSIDRLDLAIPLDRILEFERLRVHFGRLRPRIGGQSLGLQWRLRQFCWR